MRPGSRSAGAWTGVLTFGDCPLRQVPCVWPSGEFESGRVLLTSACVQGFEIFAAAVYLPPKGPTFPNAAALSEQLLYSDHGGTGLGKVGTACHPGGYELSRWSTAPDGYLEGPWMD